MTEQEAVGLSQEEKAAVIRHVEILRKIYDLREALNELTFRSPQYLDPQPVGDHMFGRMLQAIRAYVVQHLECESHLSRREVAWLLEGVGMAGKFRDSMGRLEALVGKPPEDVEDLFRGILDLSGDGEKP